MQIKMIFQIFETFLKAPKLFINTFTYNGMWLRYTIYLLKQNP